MKRAMARLALVGTLMSAPVLVLMAGPASAHEHRKVVGGKYEFIVGWGSEPTYSGFLNTVQLTVKDAAGKPVTENGDALKVDVSSGGQKVTLPLKESDEEPGQYTAALVPNRPGTYTFTFTGNMKGDPITGPDATFTSSETTFDNVDDTADIQFPAKDPSTGDLATRLNKELPRLTKKAKDDASGARTVGIVGIVLGVVGIAVGGVGLRRRSS